MQELIKVSYHLAIFGDHGHSGSEDIMILVDHVIPQDHMIQKSRDFIGESLYEESPSYQNLVAIGIVVVEI